jgi:hypothetical protein
LEFEEYRVDYRAEVFKDMGKNVSIAGLWIRIQIGSGFSDFVDPDPYWKSGSGYRGKKIKKFQCKNELFSCLKMLDSDPY